MEGRKREKKGQKLNEGRRGREGEKNEGEERKNGKEKPYYEELQKCLFSFIPFSRMWHMHVCMYVCMLWVHTCGCEGTWCVHMPMEA